MNEIASVFPGMRPVVRAREYRWAPWLFAGVAGLGGILLFSSLETARQERQQGKDDPQEAQPHLARQLPELIVPPVPRAPSASVLPVESTKPAVRLSVIPTPSLNRSYAPSVSEAAPSPSYEPPPVYNSPAMETPSKTDPDSGLPATSAKSGAVARPLADPSYTVVEGTIIRAILETALNSTRAGPTRAVVSRDVYGFDGKHVLVPRGSRLIGAYQADLSPGQSRAMVSWTRLIRPDGVHIDLKSPAIDALGRAGVPGKVNNHTMRRLGDALLQTLVNVGNGFSQRAAAPVIVIPGGTQTQQVLVRDPSAIQPTVTVMQGSRVSVFVAQDLDFSAVDDPA